MRALIVGTGAIGQRHMRNLMALFPGIELVLLRRRTDLPPPLPGLQARTVSAIADALDLGLDFAIIATPSALHIDVLPALIAAGVPSYVEKPVVTERADLEIVQATLAMNPGVPHVAGFNLRLLPSLALARRTIASALIGTIVRASFSAGQWLPDWRTGQDHRQGYSGAKVLGGGVIFDLCHEFDSARSLLGELELLSCATMMVPSLEIQSEGAACALAKSATGTLVTFSLDYVARQPIRRYELVGDKGTLIWDLAAKRLELHHTNGMELLADQPDQFLVGATYVEAMRGFVASALEGASPVLPALHDGLQSTLLAISANQLGQAQ